MNVLKIHIFKFMSVNLEIPEVIKAQDSLWRCRLLQLWLWRKQYLGRVSVQGYKYFWGIFCIHIETEPVQTTYRVGGQEKEIMEYKKQNYSPFHLPCNSHTLIQLNIKHFMYITMLLW